MSSGVTGSSEMLDSSKIQPLDSNLKYNHPHDTSSHGAAGTDTAIDQSRIDPLGGRGQHQHPAPHADSQGVIGRDGILSGTKIDPFAGGSLKTGGNRAPGLDDENIDAFRIPPGGEVREDV